MAAEPGVVAVDQETVLSVRVGALETGLHELRLDMRSLRDKVDALFTLVHDAVAGLGREMAAGDAALRETMAAGYAALRQEMAARDAALRQEMAAGDAALRDELKEVRRDVAAGRSEVRTWMLGLIGTVVAAFVLTRLHLV